MNKHKKTKSGFNNVNKGKVGKKNVIEVGSHSYTQAQFRSAFYSAPQINAAALVYDGMREVITKAYSQSMDTYKYDMDEFDFTEHESQSIKTTLQIGEVMVNTERRISEVLGYTQEKTDFPRDTLGRNYRVFMNTVNHGLDNVITLNTRNKELKDRIDALEIERTLLLNQASSLEDYRDILLDVDSLKLYIEEHYHNFAVALFETSQSIETEFVVLPEYELYIQRYGIPTSGFDEQLLSNIRAELGQI